MNWLTFFGCAIQDGRQRTTFILKLSWFVTLYWIEILTSIFFPTSYHTEPKVTKIVEKLPIIAETVITLYSIEILISNFVYYILEVTTMLQKLPERA